MRIKNISNIDNKLMGIVYSKAYTRSVTIIEMIYGRLKFSSLFVVFLLLNNNNVCLIDGNYEQSLIFCFCLRLGYEMIFSVDTYVMKLIMAYVNTRVS